MIYYVFQRGLLPLLRKYLFWTKKEIFSLQTICTKTNKKKIKKKERIFLTVLNSFCKKNLITMGNTKRPRDNDIRNDNDKGNLFWFLKSKLYLQLFRILVETLFAFALITFRPVHF